MELTEKEQARLLDEMRESSWYFYDGSVEWPDVRPRSAAIQDFRCWEEGALPE